MKLTRLMLLMLACAVAANAETSAQPSAPTTAKAKVTTSTPKSTKVAAGSEALPPGVPPVAGVKKVAFSLRYQDIKIGTGAEAEPNKMYKVHYTGWLAADGRKFDSSYDHRQPVLDKDGKPVMGDDGKPKLGDPQPFSFPQGFGRLIPGWDQGFAGMKIGGKRRLLIPWQLAYGAKGRPGPDAEHPGIPPMSDLIFDVELLDVTEMPMPPNHPGLSGMTGGHPMPGGAPQHPGVGITIPGNRPPTPPTTPSAPAATATPAQPAATAAPATPATPAQPK